MTASKSAVCSICYRPISRKADMPRHMRTHMVNKDELMHRCPFQGCDYRTLQKSNVKTHLRTHTGDKSQTCPTEDCTFATTDPGSLTRHRKRAHGYKPKPCSMPPRNEVSDINGFLPTAPYPTIAALPTDDLYSMTPTSSSTPSSEVIDLTDCDFTNYMFPSSSSSSLDSWPSSSSASTSQLDAFAWEKDLLSFPSESTGDFSQLFEQPQQPFPCSPPKQLFPAFGAGAMDESDQLWCSNFPVSNSHSVDVNFGSSFNMFAEPATTLPSLSSDGQWPATWSLSNLDASFAPNFPTQFSPPLNWEDMMGIASSCGSPTETPSPVSSSPQSISDFNLGGSMDQFTMDSFLSGCFA